MEGYILIHTRSGTAEAVLREVRELEQVIEAEAVTGPYDIVARARSATLRHLQGGVAERIERIDGVYRALACPIGAHEHLWEERPEPAYLAG